MPSSLYYVLKELNIMAQKLGDGKKEQDLAKIQRKELKEELAEQYARLPRRPRNQRRIITFVVLGIIALLAGVLACWYYNLLQLSNLWLA